MIYPESFPEGRDTDSEREFYDLMKKFAGNSREFDVFYNRAFSASVRGERLDYEIDFIVADLRNKRFNGIICIEEKRGFLVYNPDGSWTQNGRLLEKSPTQQVISAMDSLIRKRLSKLERQINYGWMVCFPDVSCPADLPAILNRDQVIDSSKQKYLKETLISYFDFLSGSYPGRTGWDIDNYERIFKAPLASRHNFVLRLSSRIDRDEQTFIKLTEKQGEVVRGAMENDKIVVRGIAGSGKTIIAKEIAQEFYDRGMDVLFLCFNKVLALNIKSYFEKNSSISVASFAKNLDLEGENLSSNVNLEEFILNIRNQRERNAGNEQSNMIRVERYHSLAYSVIEAANPGWWNKNYRMRDFHGWLVPSKIEEIKKAGGIAPSFDAVIIDEGQDFMEYWFETAGYFMKPAGKFIVFMDEFQNINQATPVISDLDDIPKFRLPENCRNTRNIAVKMSEIIKYNIRSKEGIPEGVPVVTMKYNNPTTQQTKILGEIKRLIREESISTDRILILMNADKSLTCLAVTTNVDGMPLQKLNEKGELSNTAVNYTHINTFKGLEADIVFIVNSDEVPFDERVLYTQASRAKQVLYIFEKAEN